MANQFSSTNSPLTINDLPLLCNTLNPVASKCFDLGLQLGVKQAKIRTITANNRCDCEAQLREIISERLKQDPRLSPLTWHDIVTALRSPSVNHPDLAGVIGSQYISLSSDQPASDLQRHPHSVPLEHNTESPHMTTHTGLYHSMDQYSNYPTPQIHVRMPYSLTNDTASHPQVHPPAHHPQYPPPPLQQLPPPHHTHQPHYPTPHYLPLLPPTHHPQYTHPYYPPLPPPTHQPHYLPPHFPPLLPLTHHSQYIPPYYPPLLPPTHRPQYTPQASTQLPPPPHPTQPPPPPRPTHQPGYSPLTHHRHTLSPLPSTHHPQYMPRSHPSREATPPMSQFIDYIKTIYSSSEVERDTKVVKWPPTPSKVFINLACIDRASVRRGDYDEITKAMVCDGNVDVIVGSKRPMLLNEVARDIPTTKQKVILVEGAPGVGKSTFAWEFCRRWERGEIAQQYQLVLLLRLRDDRMSRAKSLRDLIYHSKESVSEAVSSELIDTHGLHALIILEGYDELSVSCQSDHSIFQQLIAGKVLPLATVLVTSRPWATGSIRCNHESRIHQHIEILGFTSQQITQYIESTLPPDQVSDLSLYLERHPQIRMCMYIPLNSAIVVTVYQESQAGTVCALPTTRTELYTALAHTLLLRYLRGHPEYESGTKPMKTFNDIPPVVYNKFSELCKVAYSGIAGDRYHVQLIFNDLPSDFDSLGFMDSVTELYVTQGTVSSHNFLHLTFQEFLAAVHISTMSPADQLEHFQRHFDGRYRVVLRFLAGLTKLSCFSEDTIENVCVLIDTVSSSIHFESSSPYDDISDVTIDVVNWMFEAQSEDVIKSLLARKTKCINISNKTMLPLDYYSLGYCIAHSQCQWVLSLDGEVGEEEVRMFVVGANTRQEASSRVVGLRGGWDDEEEMDEEWDDFYTISAEGLNMVFTQWRSVLHLHELHLRLPVPCDGIIWPDLSGLRVLYLEIWGYINWRLDSLLPYLSLESLAIIPCNDKGYLLFEDCDAIGLHIKSKTCLKKLCVRGPISEGVEVISEALSDNQSLPLERLTLVCSDTFTDTAADCLAQFITSTTTLRHLTICYKYLSDAGAVAIAQALHHNYTLKVLVLSNNSISDAEAVALAQVLHHNYILEDLYLSNNNISDAGAVALAQALHHNSTLKVLDLSSNYSICDAGAVALAQALHHNSTLKVLDLSNNCISDAGAVAIAQALHHNPTLERLDLSDNDIGKEGTHQLVQALTVNTSITKATLNVCGLSLPWRCEEYATQCTQYNAVKDRITFWY